MDRKGFIKNWMKTYEPDTFKPNKNGRYFYRNEDLSSGIDLECFFEELLEDYDSALAEETKQQSNCNLPDVSSLLIAWEQFKKANWWESDAIDVEKVLIERFVAIYNC